MDIKTSGSVYDPHVDTPHEQNLSDPATEPSHTGARSLYNGMKTDIIPPDSQVSPYQTPFRAENTKGLTNRTQELLDPQHQSAYTLKINGKTLYSTPKIEEKADRLSLRLSFYTGTKVRMESATFVEEHENTGHKRQNSLITEKGEQPATPETIRRAAELEKITSQSLPGVSSLRLKESTWVREQSEGWAALAKHEKNIQEYEKFLREVQSTARTSSTPTPQTVSRDISSHSLDPGIVRAEMTSDRYSALLNSFKRQYNIDDARTSLQLDSTAKTKDPSHLQGRASEDTSTVDTSLETKTTEREIIEQTRLETREEVIVQDKPAADIQASEVKTKDDRSTPSFDLADLPSDRSARESDASAAEKTTTASAHSMGRTSEQLDRQYEQDLTGSDPLRLSEGHDDGSIDRPELTASPGKRSSESFSADRKTSEAKVTQSPDTGRSEQHLPGEIETQSGIHPAPGKDKLKDDEPLNVHSQQPETSLGSSGDRDTDSPTIDTRVHTPGGREPDSTFSPASLPAAQEDIRFITDEPPTATDATGHHDTDTTETQPLTAEQKRSASDEQVITVEETVVETTVEDRVEEIRHDQYRTPSPLDSHPPQQGKATDDTSTVVTDLETKTTEREIIEQTRS